MGQKVDARSDLFSAGVVLYKLVTGALPFEGDSIITVAVKIAQTDPPAVDKLSSDVPASLRRVIERALKKSPDKRFQSGEEMAQGLIAVARELAEAEERKTSGRRIPLGVRWAALMAVLVAITMSITGTVLYNRQYQVMQDQVMEYGESLAKFMATQSAVPLLAEDWAAIEVFIQETMTRQSFPYLVVIDDEGTVRGSNEPKEINSKYKPPQGQAVPSPDKSIAVQALTDGQGRKVFDFGAPILFQGNKIGDVHLAVLEEPLSRVARLILVMLAALTAVTIAAAALATYFLARRLAVPLRVLKLGLAEIGAGRYDYRINDPRRDELGEVFGAFDRAAAALEARYDAPPQPAPPSGEGTLIVTRPTDKPAKVA
jgi:serine/threonine-protein kinase